MSRKDLLIAPVCEGGLILLVSLAAWLSHKPLIFASLGPTAYELIEQPHRKSARPYNIIVGHLIAVIAGLAAVYVTHASDSSRGLPRKRPAAAGLGRNTRRRAHSARHTSSSRHTACRTFHPLVVSLGNMQRWQDGLVIMIAILLMTALGEPLRILRERMTKPE